MEVIFVRADQVLLPEGLTSGVGIRVDRDSGKILEIVRGEAVANAQHYPGILVPGFINAHCHLELSHMKGLIPRHTGMAGFIRALTAQRGAISHKHTEVLQQVAEGMFDSGIQAVLDISNENSTRPVKIHNALKSSEFYTFVEVFGLLPEKVEERIEAGRNLCRDFPEGEVSLSWHAPYSMSPDLIRRLGQMALEEGAVLSMHLLESQEERVLFADRSGPLAELFQSWGFDPLPDWFGETTPVQFLQTLIPSGVKTLWVHVTEMQKEEADALMRDYPDSAFCLCPKANLYIHNTLPDAYLFKSYPGKVLLGTDSLAGNDILDMLEELKVLSANFPEISLETLLYWSSRNAADFMGWNHLGRIQPEAHPGLIQLHPLPEGRICPETRAHRII